MQIYPFFLTKENLNKRGMGKFDNIRNSTGQVKELNEKSVFILTEEVAE